MKYSNTCVRASMAMLLFFVIGCAKNTPQQQNTQGETPAQDVQGLRFGNSALYIAEQNPGSKVIVPLVSLEMPGFVVIRDDLYGDPGVVMGISQLLSAGETKNVSIELTRSFSGEEELYAELHIDDGDSRFRQADDAAALDPLGNPIAVAFSMTGAGEEPVDISY